MQSKTLLIALLAVVFSSCSTAYKSGQTPDDVYYSPAKIIEDNKNEDRVESKKTEAVDYEISMGIRDRRWRDLRYDYDYDYRNSPYNFATCRTNNFGYYYNPYYYPFAIYTSNIVVTKPVNTTPRMVNLNAYNGYNSKVINSKTQPSYGTSNNTKSYNNSNKNNNSNNILRRILEPSTNSSSNDNRSYTPSSNSNNNSSSGSGSNSGSFTRPGRGG